MTRRYRKEGRYSKDSTIAANNRLDARRFGEAKSRKDLWTQEEMDKLLEGFLVLRLSPIGSSSLYTYVGRTRKGTETQLQKFGIAYEDKEQSYHGEHRTDRTGKKVTDRDLYLIKLATAPSGRKRKAHHAEYLGRVLGRSTADTQKILDALAVEEGMLKGMIREPARRGESPEDVLALKIHARLATRLCDFEKMCKEFKDDLMVLGRRLGKP